VNGIRVFAAKFFEDIRKSWAFKKSPVFELVFPPGSCAMKSVVSLSQMFLQFFVGFAFRGEMEHSAIFALVYVHRTLTSSVVVVIPQVNKHILRHLLGEISTLGRWTGPGHPQISFFL